MVFAITWEQRKLGEAARIFDGTHQTPSYTDHGIRFVSVENIKDLETKKYISELSYEKEYKNKPAEIGDVLMTRIGDIGTAKLIDTPGKLAYYVTLALLKPVGIDGSFLATSINGRFVQSEIWKRTLHIAFPKKINLGELSDVGIFIPSLGEQKKIAAVFASLDTLITLHQRKPFWLS